MLTFWGIVGMLTIGGGLPTVTGLWIFERRRARRRNRKGQCAACGQVWSDRGSGEPFLIHGRLVCEVCAQRAKKRLPWHLGALGLAGAGGAIGTALAEGPVLAMVLVPILTTVVMTVGGLELMKLANRRVQRRIAAGEFPDLHVLASAEGDLLVHGNGVPAGQEAALTPGSGE